MKSYPNASDISFKLSTGQEDVNLDVNKIEECRSDSYQSDHSRQRRVGRLGPIKGGYFELIHARFEMPSVPSERAINVPHFIAALCGPVRQPTFNI